MLCQSCGKRPANTHIKTIINGELTEHSLCSECAQKMGYGNSFFPSNTFDQFFSSFFGKSFLWKIHSAVLYVVPLYQIFPIQAKLVVPTVTKHF
ncbi:MAG: hypothetical protein V8Q17_03310 [Acutalibacteraceae bacterium]